MVITPENFMMIRWQEHSGIGVTDRRTDGRTDLITPEDLMMIRWQEHSGIGVTDRRTDGRTDWTIHRTAWSQLKIFMLMSTQLFRHWYLSHGHTLGMKVQISYWNGSHRQHFLRISNHFLGMRASYAIGTTVRDNYHASVSIRKDIIKVSLWCAIGIGRRTCIHLRQTGYELMRLFH